MTVRCMGAIFHFILLGDVQGAIFIKSRISIG